MYDNIYTYKMSQKKTFMSYCGHKKDFEIKKILKSIDIDISKYTTIIEPFCGMFGFSYYIDRIFKVDKYILNDNYRFIYEFFTDIQNNKFIDYLNRINELNQLFLKNNDEWIKYKKKTKLNNLDNNIDIYCYKQYLQTKYPRTFKNDRKIEDYQNLINIIKKSELSCDDYTIIMDKYIDNPKNLIYIDSPYMNSYNNQYKTNYGQHVTKKEIIDNTSIYIQILEYLKKAKCLIIMSINSNAINRFIYKDYIINEYEGTYQNTKRVENILIISNINHLKAN